MRMLPHTEWQRTCTWFFLKKILKDFSLYIPPPFVALLVFQKKKYKYNETKPVFKKFILHYLLLKGSVTLYFNKVEYHSPNNVWAKPDPIMCQAWLKLAQWFRWKVNKRSDRQTERYTDGRRKKDFRKLLEYS